MDTGIICRKKNRPTFTGLMMATVLYIVLLSCFFLSPVQGREVNDREIMWAVLVGLINDRNIPSHLIDVEVENGSVILSGWVDSVLARDRAEEIAMTVKGVRSVVNRIEVKPDRVSDEQILRLVRRALLYDPATDSYEIIVKVQGGIVTLSGRVDSWQEKKLCEQVAKSVNGVRGIRNDITVVYRERRPDREIEADVKGRLKWDAWIEDALINVEVNGGQVTLTGKVGSAVEKSQAEADAWVAGVQSVDASGLEVDWTLRDKMKREGRFVPKTDEEIEGAVKDAFRYDPRVKSFNPEVTVRNGVVILSGMVDNLKAKKAAEEVAGNTAGVRRVKNHLKVRPREVPSDAEIRKNVQDALDRGPVVDQHDITVSVLSGIVNLYGAVDSKYEKLLAEDIAARVKGVVDVQNFLDVRSTWTAKSDRELKEDIEDELFWSPFVDSDEVTVFVEDGVATLTGTVDGWRERGAAEDNAYEAGARKVLNYLKVREQGPPYFRSGWARSRKASDQ